MQTHRWCIYVCIGLPSEYCNEHSMHTITTVQRYIFFSYLSFSYSCSLSPSPPPPPFSFPSSPFSSQTSQAVKSVQEGVRVWSSSSSVSSSSRPVSSPTRSEGIVSHVTCHLTYGIGIKNGVANMCILSEHIWLKPTLTPQHA